MAAPLPPSRWSVKERRMEIDNRRERTLKRFLENIQWNCELSWRFKLPWKQLCLGRRLIKESEGKTIEVRRCHRHRTKNLTRHGATSRDDTRKGKRIRSMNALNFTKLTDDERLIFHGEVSWTKFDNQYGWHG